MRRNADLDYFVRNPLIQAINIVLNTKKRPKLGIILYATGLLVSFYYYLKLKGKQKKLNAKEGKIILQAPLNKNILKSLNEQWKNGDYDNFTYLLPQYKQYGSMSVFKNVYLYVQMDQNMQLGRLNFIANSNDLDQIIAKKLDRHQLSQEFTPQLTQFFSEKILIDFVRKQDNISSSFLKDFNDKQIKLGLFNEVKKHKDQKSLIFEYIVQKLFNAKTLFEGNQIFWEDPTPLSVSAGNQLCLKCTAIILNDEIRVTNIKAVANDFVRLREFLRQNVYQKLKIISSKINVTKISMTIFGCLLMLQIGNYLVNELEPYMLKQEYPGLDKVKQKFNSAYCDYGTRCIHCNQRPVNFIYIPCYHLQSCKQCFEEKNQLQCKTCKITIYCGISIFVCK